MVRIIKIIYIRLYHLWLCFSWGLADFMWDGFSWKTVDYITDKIEEKRRALL